ncbi:PIR Superfamily Protein [Plasmodium ovale curtisi]|uniref:PIR Superfamily Protein n=1 Tax=Plasmodium ovale curtisi TaxID=864141 RepID=A0A1A8WVT2_PLAOA|nr:PIR Superfamily Protein [Plasmodium ovale curtisi]
MSTAGDNFDYAEFTQKYNFLSTLIFDKIYKKFNREYKSNTDGEVYCNAVKNKLSVPSESEEFILHFCNILYKIIFNLKGYQNDLYEDEPEDNKIYCSSLKYWLYEKKPTSLILPNADNIYQSLKDQLGNKLNYDNIFPCTFYELDWEEMKKLKKIYAFALIYFRNLSTFKNTYIDCKYLDYLGKGLIELYNNMTACSKKWTADNFCKELKELQNVYKLYNIYLIHSTEDTNYQFEEDETMQCPLEIKSLNKPLSLLYKEGKNRWLFTQKPTAILNSSIVSASSAIGATMGISAILVYFYKFTNIGSLFGLGKHNDNARFLNMDEGTHDFPLSNSEAEHTNLHNSEYNISYYYVDNS